ncbi:MAG TPA: hypothetical protein VNH22_13465 [Blastocatellia bacterium]|jgi:hypothetical protein|nr:hypothetical protein [Blastocatellia bacterium]
MEQLIKKPVIARLYESPLVSRLRRGGRERPAPGSQAEIDRLSKGWERESDSTRAKMARIGI